MVKKIIIVMGVITLYVLGCFYSYYNKETKEVNQYYLRTVIYQTKEDMLVPISLNFYNEIDLEQEVLNRIEMMKSTDYEEKGLYPLLDKNTEINHIDFIDNILTIDFKTLLLINGNELDFIEALSYILNDYQDIKELVLSINGEESFSEYSVSSTFKNIGINNFLYTNELLHHTYPITIYQNKRVDNHNYIIPITTRISHNISLEEQINTIINHLDSRVICEEVKINNQELYITLNSNILIEDGKIEKNLYNCLMLTFSSLKDIKDVHIVINNQDIIQDSVTSYQINYIKI